jgi:hypothetical protein
MSRHGRRHAFRRVHAASRHGSDDHGSENAENSQSSVSASREGEHEGEDH